MVEYADLKIHANNLRKMKRWTEFDRILPNHGDPERIAAGGYDKTFITATADYIENMIKSQEARVPRRTAGGLRRKGPAPLRGQPVRAVPRRPRIQQGRGVPGLEQELAAPISPATRGESTQARADGIVRWPAESRTTVR
jgi:hypothetical protein